MKKHIDIFLSDNSNNQEEYLTSQADVIRNIRGALNLTQKEFGDLIQISTGFASRMETGKKICSKKSKVSILKSFIEKYEFVIQEKRSFLLDRYGVDYLDKICNYIQISNPYNTLSENNNYYNKNLVGSLVGSSIGNTGDIDYSYIKENEFSITLSETEYETYKRHRNLLKNLHKALIANFEYDQEMDYVLDSALSDISSFFRDIDIIKYSELEFSIDRISKSLKKQLRDTYYKINKDIEILGLVGAGNAAESFDFRDVISKPKNVEGMDFALKIKGNSMTPSYQDGDVIFIKSQKTLNNGDLGIFDLGYSRHVFKKFYQEPDGTIRLKSLNISYEDIIINKTNGEDFRIVGKVLWIYFNNT